MPICMCASTQPGKTSRFLASNICLDCPASISGARRAIFPSRTAMSRRSTEVLFGRTTRAFLMTRSNCFSMGEFSAIAWLDEQHIGARLAVERGASNRPIEPLHRNRIGARNDERLRRFPRVESRLDLPRHFLCPDERLVVEVTAAFWKGLVLELDRVRPCALEQPHGSADIERVAVAGVGI